MEEREKDTSKYFEELYRLISMQEQNKFLSDIQQPLKWRRSTEFFLYNVIYNLAYQYHNILTKLINYNTDITSYPEYIFLQNMELGPLLSYFESSPDEPGTNKIKITALMSLNFIATSKDVYDEEHFFKLKELIYKHSYIYTRDEQFDLFNIMESCCAIKRRYVDNDKYREEYFDIKKTSIEKGLLVYDNNFIPVRSFRSILQVALSLHEYDWVESFVNNYIQYLSPELREEMFHFSHAELSFIKGNYEEALERLRNINFKFEELKRFVKNLTIKIYYELGYFDEAVSQMESYRQFLDRNKKISDMIKMPNNNFLIYTKQLLNLKLKPDEDELHMLKEKIISSHWVSSKDWLLEKVKELK